MSKRRPPSYAWDHDSIARTRDPLHVVEQLADEQALPGRVQALLEAGDTPEEVQVKLRLSAAKFRAVVRRDDFDRRPLCGQCKAWDNGRASVKPQRPGANLAAEGCHGCIFSHLDEEGGERMPLTLERTQLLEDKKTIEARIDEFSARDQTRKERATEIAIMRQWLKRLDKRIEWLELRFSRRRGQVRVEKG